MDWLRNNSIVGRKERSILNASENCDPSACYDSFKEHWHQVLKIIQRSKQLPSHDDVLGVVNHLEQMVTLLLFDVRNIGDVNRIRLRLSLSTASHCLEYMLAENILDKLYEWGIRTGKYTNAVRLEQLKLYEMLIGQSRHILLVHEPFLGPMIKVLRSCQGEVFHKDVEKRLVNLLYQLSVLLMQNDDLIDLFFVKENMVRKFIIFALLIPFVHREGETGMQARDALLLCMSLSKRNKKVAMYIAENSSMCPLLATGLSGLYSILPNILTDIKVPDWHRLTPDDVNDVKDLSAFVTSLEFSNAVAQIAHPLIRKQMQEFLYKGFLIPVLGPALLQTTVPEQTAATAYLELILRTVTKPGLLYPLLQFLLQVQYDGQRLLDILIKRISSDNSLCLVSLAIFDLMVDINCEDLMLELVFQHLQPCLHLMLSQRRMLAVMDPHCRSFEKFLNLSPFCCQNTTASPGIDNGTIQWNHYGGQQSLYGNYHAYLCDARNKIASCQMACSFWSNKYHGWEFGQCETNLDDYPNSLLSLGESSGYESLKIKMEDVSDERMCLPTWQMSHRASFNDVKQYSRKTVEDTEQLNLAGTAGPFLTAVLEKLKRFLSNSFYINLHLTGLISRLAVYPQPLLRTYLLDHSLVLQPNVPSLYQIIGSLKQQIDEYMLEKPDCINLIKYARGFLLERETRLVNARRRAVDKSTASQHITDTSEPFNRNGPKRRSLTLSSITGMFGRRPSHVEGNVQLLTSMEEIQQSHLYPKFTEAQHVALCAILLDEWIKELAALAQEHTIAQFTSFSK